MRPADLYSVVIRLMSVSSDMWPTSVRWRTPGRVGQHRDHALGRTQERAGVAGGDRTAILVSLNHYVPKRYHSRTPIDTGFARASVAFSRTST
jgi:hypothetical protein